MKITADVPRGQTQETTESATHPKCLHQKLENYAVASRCREMATEIDGTPSMLNEEDGAVDDLDAEC